MKPIYIPNFAPGDITTFLTEIPWEEHTPARRECFMTEVPGKQYTYGVEKWARTYTSVKAHPLVLEIQKRLNAPFEERGVLVDGRVKVALVPTNDYNVCFLNCYDNEHHMLGWHADDSPTMDHDHPIASVSFGQAREIWWRANGFKGEIPADQRQMLEDKSAFIMPAGFQRDNQHRIPKGGKAMTPRVSLTYRRFIGA
jgi:alkylated DNA repair dioxygenase AlkB